MIVSHAIRVTASASANQGKQNNLNLSNQTGLSNRTGLSGKNWNDSNRRRTRRG